MKRLQFIFVVTIALSSILFSHNIIKGKVVDAITENPLVGTNITIKDTKYGTATDVFGNFILKTDTTHTIIIVSYLGYEKKEIKIIEPYEELLIELMPEPIKLDHISVRASSVNNLHTISDVDLNIRPVRSSQEVLRIMPGLFVAQHAGGGKAEQIFLRGFDIDHGTDIDISVDGIPVNMISHAHGQGYADLHFITPEIIDNVDFGKGPYYYDHGNFATAGYIDFKTTNHLQSNQIKIEADQYRTFRLLAMANIFESKSKLSKQRAYIVSDYMQTEGYFESPQNFNRINLFGKYTNYFDDDKLFTLQFSTFASKWDASGQIPQRAVDSGLIGRFGAIDDTEGGYTGRTNISAKLLTLLDDNASIENHFYFSKYYFELYSNFTFFFDDPINGDQIRQKEDRSIFGYQSKYNTERKIGESYLNSTYGGGLRYDNIDKIELSHTINRQQTLDSLAFGDIDETNVFVFMDQNLKTNRFLLNAGARVDYFKFEYINNLLTAYKTLSKDRIVVSPKLNIIYNFNPKTQLYLKSGMGFHSNDSRVINENTSNKIIPLAYGSDFGMIFKPIERLLINSTLWYLYMEQEFVYVGDGGVVEPSGRTKRLGIDCSIRYQLSNRIFADFDINYTEPRAIDEPEGENYIPLAPTLTSTGGITAQLTKSVSSGIRYRYLADRPANEDNSVIADGYTVLDGFLSFKNEKYELGLSIENIFNTEWKETQFDTETRLFNELEPVSEIHFIPGTPFCLKVKIAYLF